jgi:serine/threonine-protein kinase
MRLAPGTILRGKYQIVGKLDGSSDGDVYEAREVDGGARRAVKVLSLVVPPGAARIDELRRDAMAASAGAGPGAAGHPGIVRVYDVDETPEGSLFLVTELLRGQSLARLIAAGPLALSDVAIIIEAIAAPLDDAHRRGLVHGELTPENVFVLDAGSDSRAIVKLLDFGVAGLRAKALGGEHVHASGAAPFLAPERRAGRERPTPIDACGDVYSLGAIAHAMISVAPPAVAATVTRAMSRDRETRFGSVVELARALRSAVSPARVSGVTPTPAPMPVPAAVRRIASHSAPVGVPVSVAPAPTDRVVAPPGTRKLVATAVGGALAIALAAFLIPHRAPPPPPERPAAAMVAPTPPRPTPAPPAAASPPPAPVTPSPNAVAAGNLTLPASAPAVHRPRSAHAGMSEAAKKEMKASYQKASRAFDLRNFDEAIEAYKRTYELGGDAPMLYNIAQALRLSQKSDEAVLYYRRYLARAPKAKNRDEVLGRISELTTKPNAQPTAKSP